MDTDSSRGPSPRPGDRPRSRRRWSISLRALMLVVAVASVVLGWYVSRARTQRLAVAAIGEAGGVVDFDTTWNPARRGGAPGAAPRGPAFLRRLLGPDCFDTATEVSLRATSRDPRSNVALRAACRLPDIHSLVATSSWIEANPIDIGGPSRLKRLGFFYNDGTNGLVVTGFERQTDLRDLTLGQLPADDVDLGFLKAMPKLVSLSLLARPVPKEGAALEAATRKADAAMAHIGAMNGLKFLTIENLPISSRGLESLRGLTQLQQVDIRGSRISDLSGLAGVTSLVGMRISESPITDEGLAPIRGLRRLNQVGLQGTAITDRALPLLRDLPKLFSLDLDGTAVTDAGIATLRDYPSLSHLTLSHTRITDAGLALLEGHPRLWGLDARFTGITDASLSTVGRNPEMRFFEFAWTKVTPAGIVAWRNSLPPRPAPTVPTPGPDVDLQPVSVAPARR